MRTLAIVAVLLAGTAAAQATEINAFISTAIKAATDELLPPFERANGYTIRASYAPSGALIPRFDRGEPVDVFLTDSAAIDELIKQGKVMAGRTDLARTGIGIAVRKGAPKPDVSSAEALKRALLEARTVGHAAPSGGSITAAHIQGVFQRLSIAAEVTPKVSNSAGSMPITSTSGFDISSTTGSADAAEIDAMITTAMKAAIEALAPLFERASGHVFRVIYGPSGGLARRLNGSEPADLIVVESKVLDELIKQGKVALGRTDVARIGVGIAVKPAAARSRLHHSRRAR